MKIKYPFRIALVVLLILTLSCAIFLNMLSIINSDEYASVDHLKINILSAERGNIYTYDHQILAVTATKYELRFDGTYLDASNLEISQLADDLSRILKDKSKEIYFTELLKAKSKKFFLLKRDLNIAQVKDIKTIDFFQKPLNGGLIIQQYTSRQKPNKNSASRTIGDLFQDNNQPIYGLEYSYNLELSGRDGRQLVLHEPGVDRVINSSENIDPQTGKDLITTIELSFQDISDQALLRQLEKFEADFGTSIIMEVTTGKIKALTNLKKTKSSKYAETYNYGVAHQIEPGSTFKLASVMAYFEDFNGNIEDTIDCKNGKYKFKGAPIYTYDTKALGNVSLLEAFAQSSNIGIGRLITKYYSTSPKQFVNRIYHFGLADKSRIDLKKVPSPNIKFPNDKSWSGISLPWMSYGYGLNLTALDILTFYNAVANKGYLISPFLGYELRADSESNLIQHDQIIHTICSESTIEKAQLLLRESVINGTGRSLNNLDFSISGKTGTTVKSLKKNGKDKEYQASFVGYFPSENPQYSCIVVIDNPNSKIGYYGSQVAVPVFKEIAQKIYTNHGAKWSHSVETIFTNRDINISTLLLDNESEKIGSYVDGYYPSVLGMHVNDAIHLLEKMGHRVHVDGCYGIVKKQYPPAKTKIMDDLLITLFI